jgi:hypothetical protein
MLQRRNTLLWCAAACAGVASAAHGSFVYDTTLGTYVNYDGDLNAGLLNIADIDGRSFRVQVLDDGTGLGSFGVGGAMVGMDVELVDFVDNGDPGFGPADTASFQGVDGVDFDFMITDEFGETMSGNIDLLELTDRTGSPVLPGLEGQALITEVVFSGTTFQGVNLPAGLDRGSFYIFLETTDDWQTLGDFLETGGEGPQLTLEIRLIPAPSTMALFGLAGLVVRRRR